MEKKITLFISTFGADCQWVMDGKKESCCIPIEVGAARRDNFIYALRDNTGDNISSDNEYWGELSGLYWIWKNYEFDDTDIIGFCHYNKYLEVDDAEVISLLSQHENGWVVRVPGKLVRHAFPQDVIVIRDILMEYYPEYYNSWNAAYDEGGAA